MPPIQRKTGKARRETRRGHRHLSVDPGGPPGTGARQARTCARLLPEGGGHARAAAFRAGAGRGGATGGRRQHPALPQHHAQPAALGGALRHGHSSRQHSERRVGQPHDLPRHALRPPCLSPDRATSRPKSGFGVPVWGGGEYQYPLAPRWRLRSGADASIREYKGGSFDRHSVSAHLGPRRLIDPRTEASLLATVDRQWTAGVPETDRFGVRLEGEHRLTPRLAMFGQASAAGATAATATGSTGPVGDVSLGAKLGRPAHPACRRQCRLGLEPRQSGALAQRRAAGEPRRHAGAAGRLHPRAARLPATHRISGAGFRHRTFDRKPRETETHTLSLSVHNRAFTVLGFSPRLSVVREERDTNAQALDYKRNRAELSFVRQF